MKRAVELMPDDPIVNDHYRRYFMETKSKNSGKIFLDKCAWNGKC